MLDPRADSYGKDLRLPARPTSEGATPPPEIETLPAQSSFKSSPSDSPRQNRPAPPAASPTVDSVVSGLPEADSHLGASMRLLYAPEVSKEPSAKTAATRIQTSPLATGLKSIAVSGPVAAAIGSTIITIPTTTVGAAVLACTAAWTAINEFRAATPKKPEHGARSDSRPELPRRGLTGLLVEKFYGPGFAPSVQAICYLYSAAVGFGTGNPFIGAVFTVFAIGASAASHVGNRGYAPPARERVPLERYLKRAWEGLPERLRTVLTDPGACFCSGNFALILHQLNLSQTMSSAVPTALFAVGATLAAMGVVRGLFPLVSGRAAQPSGTASIVGGIGDISLGILSLISGNAYTGAATIAWGVSNIFYGFKIGGSFITNLVTRRLKSGE